MPMHAIFLAHLRQLQENWKSYLIIVKIGRNYDTILKTKLSNVIIAKDGEEAERRVKERFGEMDKESRGEFVIYGSPAEVLANFNIQRCGNKLSDCQLRVKERNGIARSFY